MKTTIKTIGLTAITALVLVGCGSNENDAPQADIHPYDAPPISQALKNEYLSSVNAARAVGRKCMNPFSGKLTSMPAVAPLVWDDALYRAAYEHTEDMVTAGIRTHTGSGGASDWTAQILELGRGSMAHERMKNNGMDASASAENIAGGYTSPTAVVNGWLSSDTGHCLAVMGSEYTRLGMARVKNTWTQNFSN